MAVSLLFDCHGLLSILNFLVSRIMNTPQLSDYPLPAGIKLALFDIDGTLLGLDGDYTERLKQALLAARARGMRLAVASGRPKFAADFLIDELGLTDAGLYYTGALVMDPRSGECLAEYALNETVVLELLRDAQTLGLYTELCARNAYYIGQPHGISDQHSTHLRVKPQRTDLLEQAKRQPVLKLLFAVTQKAEHQLLYQLEAQYPQLTFAYARMPVNPDWLFVSVIDEAACKRKGFKQLLDYHGVGAHEVVSFGDAQSDMVFLSLAGLGVAMGNAADDVKAVADLVTLPVWEDGVAAVLEQLR